MKNNKISTQLSAALNASSNELSQSPELSTGYTSSTNTWEIIALYSGSLANIRNQFPSVQIKELLGNYAIVQIEKELIDSFSKQTEIIYLEKPKRLFLQTNNGRRISCISPLQGGYSADFLPALSGRGTLIAIVDSGIDYAHPDFITNEKGVYRTRIISLWDQTLETIYDSEAINAAINAPSSLERHTLCPSLDVSGHGTHVAGIAAGNGQASNGIYKGVAFEASLIIVKLKSPSPDGFPSTIELMEAIDFCIRQAIRLSMPISINLSFGNTYGSHSGSSLIESYINFACEQYKCSIICGSGNEAASSGHAAGYLSQNQEQILVELAISDYTPNLSLQLWKNPWDSFSMQIHTPNGEALFLPSVPGSWRYFIGKTLLYVTVGEASPYSIYQEIFIEFIAASQYNYIDSGIWTITLTAINVRNGIWDMWLPTSSTRGLATGFLSSSPNTTLTIPSTAEKVITVGAYDSITDSIASFSGRGFTWNTNRIKPELAAPGVDIISCAPGGGYTSKSGTSMATPFVTGSCSLLMQWGIIDGNDPYMYGEKIKAALIRGTRKLPFVNSYPNEIVGWGALCLRDSLQL